MVFENYMIVKSIINGTINSGVRGDGKCAIWSILIGLSLLNRDLEIKNYPFYERKPVIKDLHDVFNIVKFIGANLLNLMKEFNVKTFEYSDDFVFNELELEYMMIDFNKDINHISILNGRCHFQILALIFGIEIQIKYEDNKLTKIGNPQNDTIRISTNGAHYNVYNNLKNTRSLEHFTNRYWWNLQWSSLYTNKEIKAIC